MFLNLLFITYLPIDISKAGKYYFYVCFYFAQLSKFTFPINLTVLYSPFACLMFLKQN